MNKKEILNSLKKKNKELNKSPGRRDVSWKLNNECLKNFGSWNNAKRKARLKIYRRKCDPLPKRAFLLDKKLARIVSYVTFDGHLYKDLRGFYMSSKYKHELRDFLHTTKNKFGLKGYYTIPDNQYGQSIVYRIHNVNASNFLYSIGTPKGAKVLTKFDVPKWIKKDKEFSREYLKICFYCEGSKSFVSKNREIIKLGLNKSVELLEDGLIFMDSLKKMLEKFDIETTKTWVTKGNLRKKDGIITKCTVFNVKSNSINKFINEIGWIK